ncbi:hypothetical protein IC582_010058 [Cucumis melo]|uniref:Uncharacterized protein n=1 Tax=Cucumis melo TaxID=3656 RepID=A0A9I9D7F4_CUCME
MVIEGGDEHSDRAPSAGERGREEGRSMREKEREEGSESGWGCGGSATSAYCISQRLVLNLLFSKFGSYDSNTMQTWVIQQQHNADWIICTKKTHKLQSVSLFQFLKIHHLICLLVSFYFFVKEGGSSVGTKRKEWRDNDANGCI